MKGNVRKSFLFVMVVSVMLLFIGAASTKGPETTVNLRAWAGRPWIKSPGSSKCRGCGILLAGGALRIPRPDQGDLRGTISCAMGNNPWPSAYFSCKCQTQDASYLCQLMMWQMEQDEAMVIIGQTPPAVRYFSIQTWAQLGPAQTIDPPLIGKRKLIGSAFGDTTNNLTIHTIGPDPFNRLIIYIIVGNRTTESVCVRPCAPPAIPTRLSTSRRSRR